MYDFTYITICILYIPSKYVLYMHNKYIRMYNYIYVAIATCGCMHTCTYVHTYIPTCLHNNYVVCMYIDEHVDLV